MPGSAPSSGLKMNMSLPPGPAASTVPFETPNRILRGARLATTTLRPLALAGEDDRDGQRVPAYAERGLQRYLECGKEAEACAYRSAMPSLMPSPT